MKKILLPIAFIFAVFLCACNNGAEGNKSDYDEIIVNVKNSTNFDIYYLEISWYQNGKLKGTQGTMNADGSKIGRGENFVFQLAESDLEMDEKTVFEFAVKEEEDSKDIVMINNKIQLQLEKNGEYNLEIKGENKESLTVDIM